MPPIKKYPDGSARMTLYMLPKIKEQIEKYAKIYTKSQNDLVLQCVAESLMGPDGNLIMEETIINKQIETKTLELHALQSQKARIFELKEKNNLHERGFAVKFASAYREWVRSGYFFVSRARTEYWREELELDSEILMRRLEEARQGCKKTMIELNQDENPDYALYAVKLFTSPEKLRGETEQRRAAEKQEDLKEKKVAILLSAYAMGQPMYSLLDDVEKSQVERNFIKNRKFEDRNETTRWRGITYDVYERLMILVQVEIEKNNSGLTPAERMKIYHEKGKDMMQNIREKLLLLLSPKSVSGISLNQ